MTQISFDSGAVEELKGLTGAAQEAAEAFRTLSMTFQTKGVLEKLDTTLKALRRSFNDLKSAIVEAAAPIGAVLIPAVSRAVNAVAGFLSKVALVLGATLSAVFGNKALGQSAEAAAQSQKQLTTALSGTGKAIKRTLAGFDQINRLSSAAGSGGSSVTAALPEIDPGTVLSPKLQAVVQKLLKLLQPLLQIDMTPLTEAFRKLWAVVEPILQSLGGLLEWVYLQIFVPFITWVAETLGPVLVETLAAGLQVVRAAIEVLGPSLQTLWQAFQPVAEFIGQVVIAALEGLTKLFLKLAEVIRTHGPQIQEVFRKIAEAITAAWQVAGPVLQTLLQTAQSVLGSLTQSVGTTASYLISAFSSVASFLKGVFTGNWKSAWGGISGFLKSTVNTIIGLINGMITAIGSGLNTVIRAANGVRFTVPAWVPGMGGKTYGFNMRQIQVSTIPYLAQGAVLPANRPFLAMVGDQRHGTNVEAPLSTIQEAVALVLEDLAVGNRAGQAAVVDKLSQILEAVLGIRLGDREVYEAVDRHRRTMAMIHGGV